MSTPNPPQNYRVEVDAGIKRLYFDVDASALVIQTKVYLVTPTGNLLLGTTSDNFIVVSSNLTGPNDMKGQSGNKGGWGLLNNPAVSVDFGV